MAATVAILTETKSKMAAIAAIMNERCRSLKGTFLQSHPTSQKKI
jgi:hypothetical protein